MRRPPPSAAAAASSPRRMRSGLRPRRPTSSGRHTSTCWLAWAGCLEMIYLRLAQHGPVRTQAQGRAALLIRIDIDPKGDDALRTSDIAIVADSWAVAVPFCALAWKLARRQSIARRCARSAAIAAAKALVAAPREVQKIQPQVAYLDAIPREVLPRDGLRPPRGFADGLRSRVHRVPRLHAAHFRHRGLPGHAGLRLHDRARRESSVPRPRGGLDHRRRRLHVRRAGAGDRLAAMASAGYRAVQ